ncbi:U3 small nucleolar RNA-associated protein 15 [Sorochytrium milnesiophthora]
MAEYQRLQIKRAPRLQEKITPDIRYWSKYKRPVIFREHFQINSLHFSPAAPYHLAATLSAKVQVYNPFTHELTKTVSRFKDLAYSGHIRADGKLLVAGDGGGTVSIFDLGSRAVLRSFQEHSGPVRLTKFSPNKTQILSGSDDKTVKIWDIPSSSCAHTFVEHKDYIRTGVIAEDNPSLMLTGSYDHVVKLWDIRTNASVMTIDHGAPVESVLVFPGSSAFLSAGGPLFKVFDIVGGGRMLRSVCNHQKTVTSMTFDSSGSRLLTGSLDHSVKVYDVSSYKVVHTMKYPTPILSIALSRDDTHLAVGMADGTLSIRSRETKPQHDQTPSADVQRYRTGTYKYFMRGQGHRAAEDDLQVARERGVKLKEYDRYLKSFRYADALDVVLLQETHRAAVVVSLIDELLERGGLEIALQGRTEDSLQPLLKFLHRHATHPVHAPTLAHVIDSLIDLYARVLPKSATLHGMLGKICEKLQEELDIQRQLVEVQGTMDMIFANSSHATDLRVPWKESDEEIIRRVFGYEQTQQQAAQQVQQQQQQQQQEQTSRRQRSVTAETEADSVREAEAQMRQVEARLARQHADGRAQGVNAGDDMDVDEDVNGDVDGSTADGPAISRVEYEEALNQLKQGVIGTEDSFGGDWRTEAEATVNDTIMSTTGELMDVPRHDDMDDLGSPTDVNHQPLLVNSAHAAAGDDGNGSEYSLLVTPGPKAGKAATSAASFGSKVSQSKKKKKNR